MVGWASGPSVTQLLIQILQICLSDEPCKPIQKPVTFLLEGPSVKMMWCVWLQPGARASQTSHCTTPEPALWPFWLHDRTVIYSPCGFWMGDQGKRTYVNYSVKWSESKNVILCRRWSHGCTYCRHTCTATREQTGFRATGWQGTIRHSLLCVKWTKQPYAPPQQWL